VFIMEEFNQKRNNGQENEVNFVNQELTQLNMIKSLKLGSAHGYFKIWHLFTESKL